MSEEFICHLCPGFVMVDDGEWFTCPCCRSRTRGLERQRAIALERMTALAMTEDEYLAHCSRHISREPIPDDVLEASVARMAREWKPACEHDTVNPFLPVTS